MRDEPQYAFDPDATPDHVNGPAVGVSHVVDESHPVGEPPGELLTDSDGNRIEIPARRDGQPIRLAFASPIEELPE